MAATARRMPNETVVEMVVDWHAAEVSYNQSVPGWRGRPWQWPRVVGGSTGLHCVSDVVLHALLLFLGFGGDMGGPAAFARKVAAVPPREWATDPRTLADLRHLISGFADYRCALPRSA